MPLGCAGTLPWIGPRIPVWVFLQRPVQKRFTMHRVFDVFAFSHFHPFPADLRLPLLEICGPRLVAGQSPPQRPQRFSAPAHASGLQLDLLEFQ